MEAEDVSETVEDMRHEVIDTTGRQAHPPARLSEQWDLTGCTQKLQEPSAIDWPSTNGPPRKASTTRKSASGVDEADNNLYARSARSGRRDHGRQWKRKFCCAPLDQLWREHIITLEHLRSGVALRGYGQRDPLNEYKSEGFARTDGRPLARACHRPVDARRDFAESTGHVRRR
jgi:preprotein translocase subunit SecA